MTYTDCAHNLNDTEWMFCNICDKRLHSPACGAFDDKTRRNKTKDCMGHESEL